MRPCDSHEVSQLNELKIDINALTFTAHYKLAGDIIMSVCQNAEWTLFSGYLSSPFYPAAFPPAARCTCSATTRDGSMFTLRTLEFHLPYKEKCRCYKHQSRSPILFSDSSQTVQARIQNFGHGWAQRSFNPKGGPEPKIFP